MFPKYLLCLFLILFAIAAHAQNAKEYQRRYDSGKELLAQGKYDLAREIFVPLSQENANHNYEAIANYYLAYAAFKTKKLDNARLQLIQLIEKYPGWNNIASAYYLLGNIAFEKGDMPAAMGYLEKAKSKDISEEVANLKKNYLVQAKDVTVLKNLQKKYPEDKELATVLAERLLLSPRPEDVELAKLLDARFKLGKVKEMEERSKNSKKDSYNVAVLFPFQPDALVPEKPRNNQYALDMYAGIKMAAEELTVQGVPVSVFAYDIGNDGNKMMELVNSPEFASMDILIGPLYSASNKVAVAFANQNNIALINPISNNSQLLQNNPSAYLLQPSVEMQALQAAEYTIRNFSPSSAAIIYGPTAKDSIMAHTYQKQFQAKGGKINLFKKFLQTDVAQLSQTISSLDEKNTGHIFVSTDNQNIVVNLISALEQKFSKLPIVTLSNWLNLKMISFEQFERRNVHFISPEYIEYASDTVKAFRSEYIKRRNIVPSIFSYQGYDMMLFFGKLLGEHGTFFHQALHQQPPVRGKILSGYNYQGSNDNQYIPLIKFQNARLVLINPL